MMCLWAATFGGMLRYIRWCCQGRCGHAVDKTRWKWRGEKVVQQTMQGLWAAVFRDIVAVQRAVLLGERQWCNG
jgi:hypothetical protein